MEQPFPENNTTDDLRSLTNDLNVLSADIQGLLDEAIVKEPIDDRFVNNLEQLGRYVWFLYFCIAGTFGLIYIVFSLSFNWISDVFAFLSPSYHLPLRILVFIILFTEAALFLLHSWQSIGTLHRFKRSLGDYGEERKIRLLTAMQVGNIRHFKDLISADPRLANIKDSLGENLLHKSVLSGNREVLEFLLSRGFGVNEKNNADVTPLHEAAARGHFDMVEMLLVHGAEVNARDIRGFTPLHIATRNGFRDVAEVLICAGANMNSRTRAGDTPILCALSQQLSADHAEIATLLIERGCDISVRNNARQTSLHLASEQGYNKVARLLIEKGAEVSAVDSSGWIPLHRAVQRGNVTVMELLIEQGADVNARTDVTVTAVFGSWTSLHFAINLGYIAAVELLLKKGADVNARVGDRGKPYRGCTPLAMSREIYSKRRGTTDLQVQKEIAELLVSHGAKE